MHDLQIVSAQHWMVRMPFHSDMEWASGRRTGVTRLVVKLTTAGGVVGWGETICLLDAIPAVLERIVLPIARTKRVDQAEALHRHVLGAGYYHHKRAAVMAICAVEMAMWDALGRATGQPLHALWGGLFREGVEMSAYILAADPGAAAEAAREYARRGHRSFKVKIGMSEATDISLCRAVREVIGEGVPMRADVNGAWSPGTARRQLEKLKGFDLQYIEQPLELDDLAGHAALRRAQPVPVALDESAYTLQDVGNIIRAEAADVVLLDPHEAGGLWPVVKQAGICESVGIPVLLHSGGELGLSQAAYLHLAASIPNMTISIDTEYAHLAADIVAERFELVEGCFAVPTDPGLGVTVEEGQLEKYRVDRIEGAYLDDRRPGWFPVKPAY